MLFVFWPPHAARSLGLAVLVLVCVALAADSQAADPAQRFLQNFCVECHGPEQSEADVRLDGLPTPQPEHASWDTWQAIARQIDAASMPPADAKQPSPAQRRKMLAWLGEHFAAAQPPTTALRRMNRVEYQHTVQDLLGVDTPLADLLPEDGSVQGFDNVATGLGLSSILMERYLEAADAAFDGVIRRIPPLPPETRRAVLMQQKDNIDSVNKNKGGVIEAEGAFVDFTPGWPPARIDEAHPIEDGTYRCRIAVWPYQGGPDRTLCVAVFAGPLFGPGQRRFMGLFDVTGTADDPRLIEFTTTLDEGESLHILPWVYPEHVTWRDKDEPRPGVAILWAETHGPLDQSFPSQAQQDLFGRSESLSMEAGTPIWMRHRRDVKRHHVASTAPHEDAERIIRRLVPRAFRRPVDRELVDPFVQLTHDRLDRGRSFEDAVRAGVTAVLCSPHFLLLNHHDRVDDYTLASRMSYFLWSSMPDQELLDLAAAGRLSESAVRHQQVERMIADDRFERFVQNFTGQWLNLRELEDTTPDKTLYPEYDELLLRSMRAETLAFFRHIVQQNGSVMQFIDSDFAFLNQRLADHYDLPKVRGHERIRRVPLPEDSVRGGLLTQASILKTTANGTSTSPVLRGAWVLDKILGQPPSPPPPGVSAIEPDIRGATTIREQLQQHSQDTRCARCHRFIDPPGFALEEFDVIGGHRSWYRSLGKDGPRIEKTNYRRGPDVQRGGQLPNDESFANFQAYREHLLQQPDVIAAAVAQKLLIYGCGRPLGLADQQHVEAILRETAADDYGFRSMLHAVVDSPLFLTP